VQRPADHAVVGEEPVELVQREVAQQPSAAPEEPPPKPYIAPAAPWARKPAAAPAAASTFASLQQEAQSERDQALAEELSSEGKAGSPLLRADAAIVSALQEMGFGAHRCKRAALATGNASVEEAMEWVFANMDAPGIDEPFDEEPEPEPPKPGLPSQGLTAEPAAAEEDWVEVEPQANASEWVDVQPSSTESDEPAAESASEPAATAEPAAAGSGAEQSQEERDAALARRLQSETADDASLAAALQLQMELEHDQAVRVREVEVNRRSHTDGASRITIDMGRHYVRGPPPAVAEGAGEGEESEVGEAEALGELTWDEGVRQYRDADGQIVTKHNHKLSGHRNAQKLINIDDAVTAELGDLDGASLPNA